MKLAKIMLLTFVFLPLSPEVFAYSDSDRAKRHFKVTNEEGHISGVVQEVVQTDRYTYLRLQTMTKSVWVATYKFETTVGELARFKATQPLTNFKSRTLDRVFSSIYFVDNLEVARSK